MASDGASTECRRHNQLSGVSQSSAGLGRGNNSSSCWRAEGQRVSEYHISTNNLGFMIGFLIRNNNFALPGLRIDLY